MLTAPHPGLLGLISPGRGLEMRPSVGASEDKGLRVGEGRRGSAGGREGEGRGLQVGGGAGGLQAGEEQRGLQVGGG